MGIIYIITLLYLTFNSVHGIIFREVIAMKLTLQQIQSITTGAVNIFQNEDGIHFRRFTDNQIEILSQKIELFQRISRCTAGCQLSFYTNSNSICVDVAAGVKYEVLINGLPTYAFQLEKPKSLSCSLPDGEKHVIITLPNFSEGILNGIELDDGSSIIPYQHHYRFVFLGDSITQGAESSRDSFCFANRISQFFDAEMLNLGVSASSMFPEILEAVDFDPDAVFIAYGTNDYTNACSIEALEHTCRTYFEKVRSIYPNKKIFYISPLWRADGNVVRRTGTLDDCRQVLIKQCNAFGFTHIDGYALVPHMPFYLNDGFLHPNDLGFSLYAQNLIRFLQNYL